MDEPRRVVLLGKTGAGKSSTANAIFGETVFKEGQSSKSQVINFQTRSVNGRSITVIDTPGFFDTKMSEEELKPEIVRCITESSPGPHAFLIVLKVEKYTKHEQAVITKIKESFSEEVFKYATVVFTHGDQLRQGQTIEEFVRENESLKELVEKCGGRCHVVDNKYWKENPTDEYRSNKFQVEQLLQTIDKMIEENNDGYYTNEMLQAVEEEIQQERERNREAAEYFTRDTVTSVVNATKNAVEAGVRAVLGWFTEFPAANDAETVLKGAEMGTRADKSALGEETDDERLTK